MSSDSGRYSKVSRRIWNDSAFRKLSQPSKESGAWLFLRLLTGPELTCIPGLFQAWEAGLAQALGWSLKGFRKAFAEVSGQGLARADWSTGLVWLPNAIKHNEPVSPNVVLSWKTAWDEMPECDLLAEAKEALRAWAEAKGPAWAEAFEKVAGKPSAKPSRKASPEPSPHPSPNQEQDQEQDQKQEQEAADAAKGAAPPGTPVRPRNLAQALEVPVRQRAQMVLDEPELASWVEPHKWPELLDLAKRFSAALGWHEPRLTSATHAAVRKLVDVLSAFDAEELDRAVAAAPTDDWLNDGSKGLSSLSAEVVGRLLNASRSPSRGRPRGARPPVQPNHGQVDLLAMTGAEVLK